MKCIDGFFLCWNIKIDKEQNQLILLEDTQDTLKPSNNSTFERWLYVVIGILSIIILCLVINKKR